MRIVADIQDENDAHLVLSLITRLKGKIVVSPDTHKPDFEIALAAIEALSAQGGISSISDPVAWQKEQRTDRPLPGRE
jgi:hypothetical protein